MLKSASATLAGRCNLLTSIASTTESLSALDKDVSAITQHVQLKLDWNSSEFLSEITRYVRNKSCPALVVAWLHRNALGLELACALSTLCRYELAFFQIIGSAAQNPPKNSHSDPVSLPSNISYHQIILGFEIENGRSRWLTDTEISDGVISAIDSHDERSIVGKITPWTARP